MSPARLALATLAFAACLGADPAGVASTSAHQEDPVTYQASSVDDLQAALSTAFATSTGPFELVLAPGRYEGRDIKLRDSAGARDISVRSAGPGPAVLAGARLSLRGGSLTVQGVALEGYNGGEATLELEIGQSATLTDVAVTGARGGSESRRPPIALQGLRDRPTTATLDGVWLTGNDGGAAKVLVDASGGGPQTPLTVAVRRSAIANNTVDTVVYGRGLAAVTFDEVVVAEPTASSLVWCAWTENTVSARDSAIALGGSGPWVRRDANPPDPSARFAAPEAAGSLVVTGGAVAVGAGAAPSAGAQSAVAAEAAARDLAALGASLRRAVGAE